MLRGREGRQCPSGQCATRGMVNRFAETDVLIIGVMVLSSQLLVSQ